MTVKDLLKYDIEINRGNDCMLYFFKLEKYKYTLYVNTKQWYDVHGKFNSRVFDEKWGIISEKNFLENL